MTRQIEITIASDQHRPSVIALLGSEKLPVTDLPSSFNNFFIAIAETEVVGAIGLEQYENDGLLRSLVVKPAYRNEHIAAQLVQQLEGRAKDLGIHSMYLLTETAPQYFSKKGYQVIRREDVPAALQRSSEFSYACPQSAIVMNKALI